MIRSSSNSLPKNPAVNTSSWIDKWMNVIDFEELKFNDVPKVKDDVQKKKPKNATNTNIDQHENVSANILIMHSS